MKINFKYIATISLALLALTSNAAFAQDLGSAASKWQQYFPSLGQVAIYGLYLCAILLVGGGVFRLVKHSKNPDQISIAQPLWMFVAAILLAAAPSFLGFGKNTVFGDEKVQGQIEDNPFGG